MNSRYFFIDTDDDNANYIRDWAYEQVVLKGFGKNQERLNTDGIIIEGIGDAFNN